MKIEEIFSFFPYKAQKLKQAITNAGLSCVGCHNASAETLRAGMMGHGMSQKMVDDLVEKLNSILLEETDPTTITLTPKAAEKYLAILESEGKQGWGLRFGLEASGCSGFSYVLDYSEKPETDDKVYESHGIQIHVKEVFLAKLLGSEIDYKDGIHMHDSGFSVSNPLAKKSCGCGSSHNY